MIIKCFKNRHIDVYNKKQVSRVNRNIIDNLNQFTKKHNISIKKTLNLYKSIVENPITNLFSQINNKTWLT